MKNKAQNVQKMLKIKEEKNNENKFEKIKCFGKKI